MMGLFPRFLCVALALMAASCRLGPGASSDFGDHSGLTSKNCRAPSDQTAQIDVAHCLRSEGTAESLRRAEDYYRQAVANSEPISRFHLAAFLITTTKIEVDHQEGVALAREHEPMDAANLGRANLLLGIAHFDGRGVDRSFRQALEHFMTSASFGNYLAAAIMACHGSGALGLDEEEVAGMSVLFNALVARHGIKHYSIGEAVEYLRSDVGLEACASALN